MEKKLIFSTLLVLITILTFSQNSYPKVVIIGNDTTIVFSKEQVKSLAITKLEMNMYKEMSDSCLENSDIMERKIIVQQLLIENYKKQLSYSDSIINQHKIIERILYNDGLEKEKEIRSLKRKSAICIGVAILTTIICIWK